MKSVVPHGLQIVLASILITFSSLAQSSPILTLELPSGQELTFTREELESLPQTTFTTSTPWTKGTHTYQGPKLHFITTKLPQTVHTIRIYAINGYSYDIEIQELHKYPFVLATQQDGKNLTLRNKGPLWVLLPFDQNPSFTSKHRLLNQAVWQVNKIKAL